MLLTVIYRCPKLNSILVLLILSLRITDIVWHCPDLDGPEIRSTTLKMQILNWYFKCKYIFWANANTFLIFSISLCTSMRHAQEKNTGISWNDSSLNEQVKHCPLTPRMKCEVEMREKCWYEKIKFGKYILFLTFNMYLNTNTLGCKSLKATTESVAFKCIQQAGGRRSAHWLQHQDHGAWWNSWLQLLQHKCC